MKKLFNTLLASAMLMIFATETSANGWNPLCGGGTIGYWSNKNSLKVLRDQDIYHLNAYQLPDGNGGVIQFTRRDVETAHAELSKWLRKANAKNMEYMLAVQWAAFQLNVTHRKWRWQDEVEGTGFTASELLYYSMMALRDPVPDRAEQEYWKTLLDYANNLATDKQCYCCWQ